MRLKFLCMALVALFTSSCGTEGNPFHVATRTHTATASTGTAYVVSPSLPSVTVPPSTLPGVSASVAGTRPTSPSSRVFPTSALPAQGRPWENMNPQGNQAAPETNCLKLGYTSEQCARFQAMRNSGQCFASQVPNGTVLDALTFTDQQTKVLKVQYHVLVALKTVITRDSLVCEVAPGDFLVHFLGCNNYGRVKTTRPKTVASREPPTVATAPMAAQPVPVVRAGPVPPDGYKELMARIEQAKNGGWKMIVVRHLQRSSTLSAKLNCIGGDATTSRAVSAWISQELQAGRQLLAAVPPTTRVSFELPVIERSDLRAVWFSTGAETGSFQNTAEITFSATMNFPGFLVVGLNPDAVGKGKTRVTLLGVSLSYPCTASMEFGEDELHNFFIRDGKVFMNLNFVSE